MGKHCYRFESTPQPIVKFSLMVENRENLLVDLPRGREDADSRRRGREYRAFGPPRDLEPFADFLADSFADYSAVIIGLGIKGPAVEVAQREIDPNTNVVKQDISVNLSSDFQRKTEKSRRLSHCDGIGGQGAGFRGRREHPGKKHGKEKQSKNSGDAVWEAKASPFWEPMWLLSETMAIETLKTPPSTGNEWIVICWLWQ